MEVFLRDLSTQVMSIRDIVIKHSFKYLIRYPQSSIGPSMMKVGMQLLQDNHSSHINKSYSADWSAVQIFGLVSVVSAVCSDK